MFQKSNRRLILGRGNDRQIELFENIFPLAKGVSYNSYLLLDEQTVLLIQPTMRSENNL